MEDAAIGYAVLFGGMWVVYTVGRWLGLFDEE